MWNKLEEFILINDQYKKYIIIPDTSIFKWLKDINDIIPNKEGKVSTVITSDVYAEIMLLYNSSILEVKMFQNNMSKIISKVRNGSIDLWESVNLRDFYYAHSSSLFVKNEYAYIFVTCSYLSAMEFAHNAIQAENIYILNMNYMSQDLLGAKFVPIVTPHGRSAEKKILDENKKNMVSNKESEYDGTDMRIKQNTIIANGYTLRSTSKLGAEAYIYSVDGNQGLLAKIFKNKESANQKKNKLILLKLFSEYFKKFAAMPQNILTDTDGSILGIIIKKVAGITLEEHLKQKNGELSDEAFKSLLAAVIALHSFDVLIGDIRTENIMIDNDKIVFIDTDSFQYMGYPGDGYNPEYLHKDLVLNMRSKILREPAHDVFSLLVLIFQKLNTNNMHPLSQKGMDLDSVNQYSFGYYAFPFKKSGVKYHFEIPHGTEQVWQYMREHDKKIYDMFVKAFNFTGMVSLGEIIQSYDLV